MQNSIVITDLFFEYKPSYDGHKQNFHYHNAYEIYFLISGQCEFFIQDKTFLISQNSIIFIPIDVIHRNTYNSKNCERIIINISEKYINPNLSTQIQKIFEKRVFVPDNFEFIKSLITKIGNEYKKGDEISTELIKAYLTELFSYFIRNENNYVTITTSNPAIERLVKYINANFNQSITLESSANILNLNISYLSRLFSKNTGFNFKEYLLTIRIKNAKNMLKNTNNSIKQIAYDCGFNDSNYFSKTFKKFTNLTPLQYRKHE